MHIRPVRSFSRFTAICILAASTTGLFAQSSIERVSPGVERLPWQVVLDGVMGGLSTGGIERTGIGSVRFTGQLSLENNGGFSQIRTPVDSGSFADASGIELRIQGDGRSYTFDVRTTEMRRMASSYQQSFDTLPGIWLVVRLPFENFEYTSFGETIRSAPTLNTGAINSVGFTLADKNEGGFELVISEIVPYIDDQEGSRSLAGIDTGPNIKAAIRVYELAVQRGVPIFNDGQPAACAAIYEIAMESILAVGTDTIGVDTANVLATGLREGREMRDAARRAWAYRVALDEAAEMMRTFAALKQHSA